MTAIERIEFLNDALAMIKAIWIDQMDMDDGNEFSEQIPYKPSTPPEGYEAISLETREIIAGMQSLPLKREIEALAKSPLNEK